jgi:aminoglycoside 6'-N-acetyltransferase I
MHLIDIRAASDAQRREAARILVDALARFTTAWKTLEEAEEEVATFLAGDDRRALVACEGETVLGWVGAITEGYSHAWELHPLVVDPPRQGRGVGTALLTALERMLADAGVLTLFVLSDDDYGGTSLYGRDLFPDPLAALARIEPTSGHPFTFYRRMGYAVCGVIPDADGPGRPDILLAKRVGAPP